MILMAEGGSWESFCHQTSQLLDKIRRTSLSARDDENSTLKRFRREAEVIDIADAQAIDAIFPPVSSLVGHDCRAA